MSKRTRRQWLLLLVYLLAFGILWYSFQHSSNTLQPKHISYSDFAFLSCPRNATTATKRRKSSTKKLRRISDTLYLRAKTILNSRRAELERIAAELIRKETLDRPQIELLLLATLKQVPLRG